MSMHEETELNDRTTLSANEINSKSDEAMPNQKQQNPIDFLIVTRIPEKTYKFQWIIRQFSTLAKNIGLYSTCIYTSAPSHYLKLVKYEHGFGLFYEREFLLQTTNVSIPTTSIVRFGATRAIQAQSREPEETSSENKFIIMLKYQISATDGSGKELMKWSVCFSDDSESPSCKIGDYINNTLKKFSEDSLILDCALKVTMIPTTEKIPIASRPSLESNGWKKLSMDLKALYQNSLDADVTLIVGNDKIRAHKSILTARSTIFKKTFHHDMVEAEKNSVVITDVQFPALQRLVEYLYTGIVMDGENKDLNLEELYDLYYAADKYEVMDLREMVGNTLLGRIQVDNASEILVWADRHNDKDLKSKILNFIRLNFEAMYNKDTWESCLLHHSRLAAEVVNFCQKIQNQ